jgi:hypothetical protein
MAREWPEVGGVEFTATFDVRTTFEVSGEIRPGLVIPLPDEGRLLARQFRAPVHAVRRAGGMHRLAVDRYVTALGPQFTPGGRLLPRGGLYHFWVDQDDLPSWVRLLVRRIESTECLPAVSPPPVHF